MALAVVLPKKVAIRNRRLAILHFTMVFSLLFTLLYTKVYVAHEHLGVVPVQTNLEMKWDEMASIAGMENFLGPSQQAQCDNASTLRDTTIRWGHNWSRRVSCTELCILDEFLTHAMWSENMSWKEQKRNACWSSFKDYSFVTGVHYTAAQFTESRGTRDVSIITSKNDWHVDHGAQTRTNFLEMVPQSKAAVLDLGYRYELGGSPSWFPGSSQHQVSHGGGHRDARTLILDAEGKPVGDLIPPGGTITLSLDDVWLYAGRADGEESLPLTKEVLANGAEILAMAACFGDDRHLVEYISEHRKDGGDPVTKGYGASLEDLVCVIRFEVVSAKYQIHASFVAPVGTPGDFSKEVLSETTGISIKAVQVGSTAEIWDWNTLMLQFTSFLVLLAIPVEVTAFISIKLLGPLSRMYKRMLIEPYCIEEVAAMTSTVLAQNVASFYQLSSRSDDGSETIKLHALQLLTERAFANRSAEMSEEELLSLSSFLYEGVTKTNPHHVETLRGSLLGIFLDIDDGTEAEEEARRNNGITLDQWNKCRLDCEKITFEALVKLFDKDRQRSLLEKLFTPSKIKHALSRAMTPEQKAKSHFYSLHCSQQALPEPAEGEAGEATPVQSFALDRVNRQPSAVHLHLPAEVTALLARVQALEEEKEERSREAGTENHLEAKRHCPEPKDGLQPAMPAPVSAPAPPWTEAAPAPGQLEAEFPPGVQPAALLLESRELNEAFTYTIPFLAEKLTSIESAVSSLAGDLARLKGTAPKCEACDGYWARTILASLPPDVMQELADVRGGMDQLAQEEPTVTQELDDVRGGMYELVQGELASAGTPTCAQEGHGQASSAPAEQYAAAKWPSEGRPRSSWLLPATQTSEQGFAGS